MQGQRSIYDPFPEPVDLNQGSSSNNTGMDESDDWNNMLSPMERRLLNNDLSSELNFSCVNTSSHNNSRSFSGWDVGESSSRSNFRDRAANDGLKVEESWSPSFGNHDSRLEERQFESSNLQPREHDSFSGGQVALGPLSSQSSGSHHIPMNVNLNVGYGGNNNDDGGHGMGFTNPYKSGRPEMETGTSSAGIGVSSECGSDSSLSSWGVSCKRKALEGTSGQSLAGGSSGCIPQPENIVRHNAPVRYNASSGASISSPVVNPLTVNRQEQLNTRIGVGMRGAVASDAFPPSVQGVPETQRHFGMRESIPFNISSSGNPPRRSNTSSSHQQSRRLSLSEFLEQTSRNPNAVATELTNASNQSPPLMHFRGMPRNVLPFPWNGNINSRSGSSSTSVALTGERGTEANFRSTLRNNVQHHNFIPSSESRNLVQDPTNWSLATGSASTSGGGAPSSSRNSSSSRPFNAVWIPYPNASTQTQQRLSEFPPWTLFPSADTESGGQRGHFLPFPSGSSSTADEHLMPSGVNGQGNHHQPYSRSALLMEVPGDDWRALAADIEGRQRLVSEIRQVLNAMRRGENLRAEDYMIFDPFINGVAELHDRHRDMRLDVDNMSYEELLALEERIGNVNTGLSEEVILKSMKQRKHIAFMAVSTPNLEPCCICQEEYDTGDDIGTLDCGHDFHRDCIKQWLAQKNLCPICKMTALAT